MGGDSLWLGFDVAKRFWEARALTRGAASGVCAFKAVDTPKKKESQDQKYNTAEVRTMGAE